MHQYPIDGGPKFFEYTAAIYPVVVLSWEIIPEILNLSQVLLYGNFFKTNIFFQKKPETVIKGIIS